MADHSEALELLPPRLREIAAVIGLDKTLALATAVGGLRIYVPASVDADHALATAIGLEAARKLCKAFARHAFPVPRGKRYLQALVRRRALERFYAGESAAKIAAELHLHEITIYNWAGSDKRATAAGHPSLF